MVVAAALEVLVVGPAEVVEPLRRDLDDPVREPGDEPAVVGDEDQRPVVLVQRRDEGLDRLDVEVVRRLVEDEDVGAEDREAGEDEARALAAGEGADGLVGVVAREEDVAQVPADEADRLARGRLPEPRLDRLLPGAGELGVVLREVARVRLVAPRDLAGVRREVADGDLQERRLADAVRADDRQAVSPLDLERDVLQDDVVAPGLADAVELEGLPSARPPLAEPELRVPAGALGELVDDDLLDHLDLALRLPRLGRLRPEAVDEGHVPGDLLLALRDLGFLPLPFRLLGGLERGEVPRVEHHRLVVDVRDVGADVVEEAVVVRDDDREALVGVEELLEPADRDDVEVVRRLVHQERARVGREDLPEEDPELEPAREGREQVPVDRGRDPEPLQDLGRPRLERVPLVPHDDVLELGVAVALERGVGVKEALLLGHRLPDLQVPHHRHVDDRHPLVAEVVLLQDAEPELLRDRDDAGRGGLPRRRGCGEGSTFPSRSRRRGRSDCRG